MKASSEDIRFTPQDLTVAIGSLIVTGADDLSPVRGREPGESARLLHDSIPGSQLLVIPGARHYPHIDHPDLFNEAVLSFLNSIPI